MSVIVKGMEMPNNCAECERWSICKCLKEYEDYESILYAVDDGDLVRADGCPLVEIPTPHGRLIDIDDTIESYGERAELGYVSQSKFLNVVIEEEGNEE